jgi:hypothetical protein
MYIATVLSKKGAAVRDIWVSFGKTARPSKAASARDGGADSCTIPAG